MLRNFNELIGYSIEAQDGQLGKVSDFYFDDYVWRVRYLIGEAGGWLTRKEILISPAAIDSANAPEKTFPITLTREQVRNSPLVETGKPVSRETLDEMISYYGWPMWPMELAAMPDLALSTDDDPHLRSMRELIGYSINARAIVSPWVVFAILLSRATIGQFDT